jgi:iron complex outermembrane receptor protein
MSPKRPAPFRPHDLAPAVLAALTGIGAAPAALAQDMVITVTAQRRDQALQEVPLPVTALRAVELDNRGITDTLKLSSYVPNLVGSNNTGLGTANVYFLRGLGNTESIATFDPPVGTYVDDIYVSRQNANNFGFFDVDRIEVLRGPQGTLFGRNTTGGAINVILKRPSFKPGGYFGVGLGSYNEVSARGSVDLPLGDKVATKFSFFAKKDKGYADNVTTGGKINEADAQGVRAALRWQISSDLGWDVALEAIADNGLAVYNRADGSRRVSRSGLNPSGFVNPATGAPRIVGEKATYPQSNEVRNGALTSKLRWSLSDSTSLEFITGWRDLTQKFALDFGDNPAPTGGFTIANDGRHEQFSQEVKLVADIGRDLNVVAGLFYLNEKNRTDFADIFLAGTTVLVLADRLMKNDTTSGAVYAQADYKIAPQLTATFGLRHTADKKTISYVDQRATVANPALRLTDANLAAAGIPLEQKTDVATPRVALAWQMAKEHMLFASATRGFKSGGWNARGTAPALIQPFLPEYVWSYEAGWRSSFLDHTLRLNGTLFSMRTKQLQTISGFVNPVTGAQTFITRNFADLKNDGLELDLNAQLARELSLFGAYGYQDARYANIAQSILDQQAACKASIAAGATTRPSCSQGIVSPTGDFAPPVRTPRHTLNLGSTYTAGVGGGLQLQGTLAASYSSRTSVATAGTSFAEAHTAVNASLALLGGGGAWRLALDCTNCTDKVWNTTFLNNLNYLPDPRRWTLRFLYTFK